MAATGAPGTSGRLALAALVLVAATAAPARIVPHIVNGVPTAGYPAVGALLHGDTAGGAGLLCSGTLIGCRTFLTAAHCVEHDFAPDRYFVFLQHGGVFAVADVAMHPAFDFPVGDVAVLTLAAPVTGIAPAPIETAGAPAFGTPATIVGFGRTGGDNLDYGLKRAGAVVTESCTASGFSDMASVCWEFSNPLGPPGTNSGTCQGDSGGPLLVADGAVAGVTSGGTNPTCLPVDAGFDANVFAYRAFIEGVGGADLATTACGSIPQAGSPETIVHEFSGSVSAAVPEGRHEITVAAGISRMRITMNALDFGTADFDLYVKAVTPPTLTDYDCRQDGAGQFAGCDVLAPAAGTWHLLIERAGGAGAYQATVTEFGTFCTDPAHAGAPCDDGSACTEDDRCEGGVCVGVPLADGIPCDDGHICTRGDTCQAGTCTSGVSPIPSCKHPVRPGKGSLVLKSRPVDPNRDRFGWKWTAGSHTDKAELGTPTTITPIGLCLYDDGGGVAVLVMERTIPAGTGWSENATGFRFNGAPSGSAFRTISLRAGADGRASISAKGRGPGLAMIALPLQQSPTVRLQLVAEDACWEAVYSTSIRNSPDQFKAKAD